MSDPIKPIPAKLTKHGDALVGVIPKTSKPKDQKPKTLQREDWDEGLATHFATMAEDQTVSVEVSFGLDGQRTARLVGVAALPKVDREGERDEAIRKNDGFVNPYTFVPTLPREKLARTALGDAEPDSHARIVDGQWSGSVALALTTVTPLLLPVPAATQPADKIKTFDVRVDAEGLPLIHGASFKGALRSAYETVTASRYGVFFDHDDRLAYRVPANTALDLTPARVCLAEDGTKFFRLCQGDAGWLEKSQPGNEVQYAAWVPAYSVSSVRQLGELAGRQLTKLHGRPVHARVVLYQYERATNGKTVRFQVWRATHLADSRDAIEKALHATPAPRAERSGRLTPVQNTAPRIVQGWLSATGYSIKTKHDERLFVGNPGSVDVPVTPENKRYWQSVLAAYQAVQNYHDPDATYSRSADKNRKKVERSYHVDFNKELQSLPEGTLVYVRYDRGEVTQVHPVMIGRLPFDAAPDELLHESLRPAQSRDQLSPADRLFGWVPPGRRDDGGETNDGASGHRGRLRVRSITCTTEDWGPVSFPPEGVTLAPLSSPKPTQFRFYASSNPETGHPMERGAAKTKGYTTSSGLRGRKMYRWREEKPEHWQPVKGKHDPTRGYLALPEHDKHATQLVRHLGWVQPGVTFQVELFLDGVQKTELGPLLWLLTRGTDAPLRLGAGKPYGFGVVTAELDVERTRLWDADRTRDGWLSLHRPDPVGAKELTELAEEFHATARANEVLHEATESYLRAAAPVTEPVHYPRVSPEPQAESYQWFVLNEKVRNNDTTKGWALPHVRDPEQRLPYLSEKPDDKGGGGGRAGTSQHNQKSAPRPTPPQQRKGLPSGQGADRPGAAPKNQRGRRRPS